MELVIDRSKWGVGQDDGGLLLGSNTGRMCCLGFMSLVAGLNKNDIMDTGMPDGIRSSEDLAELVDLEHPFMKAMVYVDDDGDLVTTEFASQAAAINDAGDVILSDREARLIKIFAEQGIDLQFTGEYGTVLYKNENPDDPSYADLEPLY